MFYLHYLRAELVRRKGRTILTLLGLALGVVTARYLNTILADFPGLPAAFEFFVFRADAAWRSLGLLVAGGVLAGVYPAWRAGSLPISRTLREEAVG